MSDAFLQVGLEGIIERLSGELASAKAEVERLTTALQQIAALPHTICRSVDIARAALEGK